MTTDQVAPRQEPVTAPIEGLAPAAASPQPEAVAGEWVPPSEGWASVPAETTTGPASSGAGRWTGKKVIAAVALTAALAGGAGFGIGMAVDSGSGASQQGGPGGGFGGGNGGPGGGMGGGGFGNQQGTQGGTQDGTTQQGAVPDGTASTT
ncbi:hypothetical protein ACQPZX_08445 [Actinoplanes sp. CA-142083]|uniref:hypothetical protein n=1 Tax=Actinoplanes sp. CA-142083 TaxID=3239903 RepID=UPI003D8F091E